jgi:hypothetical protein
MKYLYKYPQTEYPYKKLMDENLMRNREVPEYEILDTDVFEENRYWDIVIEVLLPLVPLPTTPSHDSQFPLTELTIIVRQRRRK